VCLQSLAAAAAPRAPHRAARLFGAAAAFRNSTGSGTWGRSWLRLGETARELRDVVGADAYDAAWSAGASLSVEQAVAEALVGEVDGDEKVEAALAQRVAPLTPREWEVAKLVADGLTNRRIGDALVITEGTAAIHVKHILNKLGFDARAQIASWVTRRRDEISSTGPGQYPDR
jgi:DNA-binding CsgD family transcriptional regulator